MYSNTWKQIDKAKYVIFWRFFPTFSSDVRALVFFFWGGGGSYLLFIEDIEGVESGNDNNDAVVRLLDLTGNVARGEEVEDVIVTEIFNKIKYF